MILEVNNTFDERQMYLLKDSPSHTGVSSHSQDTSQEVHPQASGDGGKSEKTPIASDIGNFTAKWPKEFHVSPFNSRKGSYSLAAIDPFSPHHSGNGIINNTITLSSSKAEAKLVARVFSTSAPVNPSSFDFADTAIFVAKWWWVGFVTFPRIVHEAAKLFFRRKLHVWFRPEVKKGSIGRTATQYEKSVLTEEKIGQMLIINSAIASVFQDHLESMVQHSTSEVAIKYVSAVGERSEQMFRSGSLPRDSMSEKFAVFEPMTPLFYAKLARAADQSKFLTTEIQISGELKSTLHTTNPATILKVVQGISPSCPSGFIAFKRLSLLERLRWWPLRIFRTLSYIGARRDTPYSSLTPLDWCAINSSDKVKRNVYRRAVTKYLLSDYVSSGMSEIIDLIAWLIRTWLCWWCGLALATQVWQINDHCRHGLVDFDRHLFYSSGIHLWSLVAMVL